jgi:guanylate kinase
LPAPNPNRYLIPEIAPMKQRGLILIISGPSGVGKTTIAHRVERELGGLFSVSITTRPQTEADRAGVDYIFVDAAEFARRLDADELLEHAEVFGYHYGTPRQPALDALEAGKLFIVEIDVAGGIQVKAMMPAAYALFIEPPSEATLLERLRRRRREEEDVIQRRFAMAKGEISRARECGAYDQFVVNDELDTAVDEVIQLVGAEWARRP